MASPRDLRRLAFQTLFQLDARGGALTDAQAVRDSLEAADGFTADERQRAFDLAAAAFERRDAADRELEALAPDWPAHRQAAADRAILRLSHHELTLARAPGRVVISDAVELAKEFGTDRSPAFVNALLDKVYQRVRREASAAAPGAEG